MISTGLNSCLKIKNLLEKIHREAAYFRWTMHFTLRQKKLNDHFKNAFISGVIFD